MKHLLFIGTIYLLGTMTLEAQRPRYMQAAESDPKAKAILDKVRDKYESFETLKTDFSLYIEIPEEDKIVQKGKVFQKGNKYRLEMEDQDIISDGTSTWYYLKEQNEVQITDASDNDDSGLSSIKDLYRFYEKDEYIFALTNQGASNGRYVAQIEFKPIDRYSDYSKLRLTVDKNTYEVVSIKAFSKDGSRYTLAIDSAIPNKEIKKELFAFNAKKHPDVHIEDLRLD